MTKFKRPPSARSAEEFIDGAGMHIPISTISDGHQTIERLPWEGKRQDKQTEVFNVRLTEVELEQLRFISKNTPDSIQSFIRKALLPAIDKKLGELIK